jgi:hypothetical protein
MIDLIQIFAAICLAAFWLATAFPIFKEKR